MKLRVLVGSLSAQKHQDLKSQECEFPSLESVIVEHQWLIV